MEIEILSYILYNFLKNMYFKLEFFKGQQRKIYSLMRTDQWTVIMDIIIIIIIIIIILKRAPYIKEVQ